MEVQQQITDGQTVVLDQTTSHESVSQQLKQENESRDIILGGKGVCSERKTLKIQIGFII